MAKQSKTITRYIGGIAEFDREGTNPDSYAFGRSIDVRTNPQNLYVLPRTIKESGSVIKALPKWGEYVPLNDTTYIYDEGGNFYSRDNTPTYTLLHTVPNSQGNGMAWFGEDNFVYYTSDNLIGRYGPIGSANPTFVDDFFGSQGGTPLNTGSLLTGTAKYASRADTASLSITGDLSIEAWIKPTTLPTGANTMTLVSKWTENGNLRSYKFGIGTSSNFFGDGSDGALTISVNATETVIDSACTGSVGTYALSATNVSFAANQKVLIIQMYGTGAGNSQINTIQSYTAGAITLISPLNADYITGAQVRVIKQYSSVTVNNGITWACKDWNGTTGGILAFLCSGTFTNNGTITAVGNGFRGGAGYNRPAYTSPWNNSSVWGYQGEGTLGIGTQASSNNGNGGAGAYFISGPGNTSRPGAGGGNGTNGDSSYYGYVIGGLTSGSADLTTKTMGGGGGGASAGVDEAYPAYAGGDGGGILALYANSFVNNGTITANGAASAYPSGGAGMPGGGGGGGSVDIKFITGTLGTITASGGVKPALDRNGQTDGTAASGGAGRIAVAYLTSYSGTTTPTANVIQDATLSASGGYSLFLSLSANGTAYTTFSKPADLQLGVWQNVAVAWNHSITGSSSEAEFFLAGVSLGTVDASIMTIQDNASTFNISMDRGSASAPQNLYDGLIDEVRLWAGIRTGSSILGEMFYQINPASIGLVGYWQFNQTATDATANGNNLTLTGATYSTDVPFPAPTTRADIDQYSTASGDTYTLPTTIIEDAANKKTFVPTRDPQKSLRLYVSGKGAGTGSWTLTVHDSFNNVMSSVTVAKSALPTSGDYEFLFTTPWRTLTNFTNTYHFHITDSDGTGTVKTSSNNDLSTVNFTTYFSFLITDINFHPVAKFLQFLVVGNERYIGTLEATLYNPNKITLPAGWSVRCFGYWNEYLAIGVIKGNSVSANDNGRVYFWDGIALTYNFYVDVPEGGINAVLGARNQLYVWAGYQGDLLSYTGLYGTDGFKKLRRLPKVQDTDIVEVYPGAVSMWKSLLRWGAVGSSTSTEIQRGVYTYGSHNNKYPEILTYDYPISTGNLVTTPRIGMVTTVHGKLLIGWADGTGYGIDNVYSSNPCYPTATIEFIVDDNNVVWKEKELATFVVKGDILEDGQTITPKAKFDDTSTWVLGETATSTSQDNTLARMLVSNKRNYEMQLGIDITTTGVSPLIKGVGIEIDDLKAEGRV